MGNTEGAATEEKKYLVMEDVASSFITALKEQSLSDVICGDLEKHAYSVNDKIADGNIRTLNILATVGE